MLAGIAWGNGALNSGAGPAVSLGCASCHNPHGNGQYRILNPIPSATGLTAVADPGVVVTDAALPPAGDARNYTVIQTPSPNFLLLASQVVAGGYSPTAGDYFHRGVPWDTRLNNDAPNGIPGGTGTSFNDQIIAWCCRVPYAVLLDRRRHERRAATTSTSTSTTPRATAPAPRATSRTARMPRWPPTS